MSVHLFGIRHHGPGSARSLRQSLTSLQPDVILVEGPPEAESILQWLTHAEMKPPVAILIYPPDHLEHSVYYPFAVFSPEWQALRFGLQQRIPVHLIDLPQAHRLALKLADPPADSQPDSDLATEESSLDSPPDPITQTLRQDPLGWLGRVAGYEDGERWWEHLVEQRRDSQDLFAGIQEMMTALRQEAGSDTDPVEALREAQMRKRIRAAVADGHERIAVICGAWHVPALVELPPAKTDEALLKGLPKLKVEATWIPWTNGRLSVASGYGAGIHAPGWYHHLWTTPDQVVIRWLTQVARLLRARDVDVSSASVIEAVRLAESLAAMRDRPLPGLEELNEAIQTVMFFGDPLPLQVIYQQLIIGETLGEVPTDTPMVPLQKDLSRLQKSLRLKVEATERILDLDLRQETDRIRSTLFHRLTLLNIPWGHTEQATGKGTFRERWRIRWQPEFMLKLIEAGVWGNTVRSATVGYVSDLAQKTLHLPTLTGLLDQTLWADLPEVIQTIMARIQAEAAVASDIAQLMQALPPLVNVLRYGNVRQTDASLVEPVVNGLIARICVGLPVACASLNDEAAAEMDRHILAVHQAITLLDQPDHEQDWHRILSLLVDQHSLHGLLAGRGCRLLLDSKVMTSEEVSRRLSYALSQASDPAQAAAWIEGLLKGSGLVLLHDEGLWAVLDQWISHLPDENFLAILPLLRRTFATFPAPERRQMGEKVRRGSSGSESISTPSELDPVRANRILPILAQLLGIEVKLQPSSG